MSLLIDNRAYLAHKLGYMSSSTAYSTKEELEKYVLAFDKSIRVPNSRYLTFDYPARMQLSTGGLLFPTNQIEEGNKVKEYGIQSCYAGSCRDQFFISLVRLLGDVKEDYFYFYAIFNNQNIANKIINKWFKTIKGVPYTDLIEVSVSPIKFFNWQHVIKNGQRSRDFDLIENDPTMSMAFIIKMPYQLCADITTLWTLTYFLRNPMFKGSHFNEDEISDYIDVYLGIAKLHLKYLKENYHDLITTDDIGLIRKWWETLQKNYISGKLLSSDILFCDGPAGTLRFTDIAGMSSKSHMDYFNLMHKYFDLKVFNKLGLETGMKQVYDKYLSGG